MGQRQGDELGFIPFEVLNPQRRVVRPTRFFDVEDFAEYAKRLTHIAGHVEVDDLARCDEVMRRRVIEPRILPLILLGDFV